VIENVEVTKSYDFPEGAFMNLKQDSNLPTDPAAYNFFKWLQANSDVSFGKAKALYDINIAVLKIEGVQDSQLKDLTYESDMFCTAMATYLGKYSQCLNIAGWYSFRSDSKNAKKTAFVFINNDDITTRNVLFTSNSTDSLIKFGVLVIPDIILGNFCNFWSFFAQFSFILRCF